MIRTSITPGQLWLDSNGNRIQAHGGSIIEVDGTFYWYGENKERSTPGSGIWHWGVRCYSSIDLYSWTDCGLIIPPDVDDATSPLTITLQSSDPGKITVPAKIRSCMAIAKAVVGAVAGAAAPGDVDGPAAYFAPP